MKEHTKNQAGINKSERLITYKLSAQQLIRIAPNMNHMMKKDQICSHTNQLKQQQLWRVVGPKNIPQMEISMTQLCKSIDKK